MRRCELQMREGTGPGCAWMVALALGWLAASAGAAARADGVEVRIDAPVAGEVVRNRFDMAPFSGLARSDSRSADFDVVLVLDVSGSTEYCSGADVDGDGVVGRRERALLPGVPDVRCSDPGDSILAAEVAAARALLADLDPTRVRAGVVRFAGRADPGGTSRRPESTVDAVLEQPLAHDRAPVRAALERIAAAGPDAAGGTNIAHGLRLAARELAGGEGAVSVPRPLARPVILLLTDGEPTLPHGRSDDAGRDDLRAAVDAARAAAERGIVINVYGLGPAANRRPLAPSGISRVSHGVYVPVERPGDIVSVFSGVSFANIESVVATNLSLGRMAEIFDVQLRPDGSFRGFVPVAPGLNRVLVSAFGRDGGRGSAEFEIRFRRAGLTGDEKRAELEQLRARTRAILLEQERRRQEGFRQRERRRALAIEAEDSQDSPTEENDP